MGVCASQKDDHAEELHDQLADAFTDEPIKEEDKAALFAKRKELLSKTLARYLAVLQKNNFVEGARQVTENADLAEVLSCLFELADTDKNGDLTCEEWTKIIPGLGSEENWKKVCKSADHDQGGTISLYEWLEYFDCDVASVTEAAKALETSLSEQEQERAKKLFAMLDDDGSGTLQRSEMVKIHSDSAEEMMKSMDKDGSGKIDYEEWLRYLEAKKVEKQKKGDKKFGYYLSYLEMKNPEKKREQAEAGMAPRAHINTEDLLERLEDLCRILKTCSGDSIQVPPEMVMELVRHGLPVDLVRQALDLTASNLHDGYAPALAHLALHTGLPPMVNTMRCVSKSRGMDGEQCVVLNGPSLAFYPSQHYDEIEDNAGEPIVAVNMCEATVEPWAEGSTQVDIATTSIGSLTLHLRSQTSAHVWAEALAIASRGEAVASTDVFALAHATRKGALYQVVPGSFGSSSLVKSVLAVADDCTQVYRIKDLTKKKVGGVQGAVKPVWEAQLKNLVIMVDYADAPRELRLVNRLDDSSVTLQHNESQIKQWEEDLVARRTAVLDGGATPVSSERLGHERETSAEARVFLMACLDYARRTGQDFTNGSFIMIDDGSSMSRHHLFENLRSSPAHYGRTSSHLHHPQQPKQYGIDIPDFQWSVDGANTTMRTCLFCKVSIHGSACLFFKPESEGLRTAGATLAHGLDYIRTRPMVAAMVGEKAGPKRKERIPSSWAKAFGKLIERACKEAPGSPTLDASRVSSAKKAGLYAMLSMLEEYSAACRTELIQLAAEELGHTGQAIIHPEDEQNYLTRVGSEVFIPIGEVEIINKAMELRRAPDIPEEQLREIMSSEVLETSKLSHSMSDEITLKVLLSSTIGSKHLLQYVQTEASKQAGLQEIKDAAELINTARVEATPPGADACSNSWKRGGAANFSFSQLLGYVHAFVVASASNRCIEEFRFEVLNSAMKQ